ncbi:NUDIX hydrolase [Halomonas heilongjiangensis]|uniref:ADP-ribose pyrophosphatase n=1 Tax=Halomonas heilongjiangensis TaxID=1387883 RepID=A0A2N7TI01_9GAMM|nr:NUDIX domain-containing protein [Halomonas heilongjiangensis]PMR67810.1 ADP-ribose pyrophosphatase [Halomonas heilongjiangensis]PXX88830.1 ADP-ribose pyrophosphatase [Halomonas heilongjiangensis]
MNHVPPVSPRPVAAVSAALVREGRLLMVRRRHPPNAGYLALPGGKIEAGESLGDAAVRELLEETGLHATPHEVLTAIDVLDHDGQGRLQTHYVVVVIRMAGQWGVEAAADDASELYWMDMAALEAAGDDVCRTAAEVARRALRMEQGRNHR